MLSNDEMSFECAYILDDVNILLIDAQIQVKQWMIELRSTRQHNSISTEMVILVPEISIEIFIEFFFTNFHHTVHQMVIILVIITNWNSVIVSANIKWRK